MLRLASAVCRCRVPSLSTKAFSTLQSPKVIISCAVNGSGDTVDTADPTRKGKSPHVPFTPEAIAADAVAAAKAGAAVVHCHVRDPVTGAPGRKVELYEEVARLIRASDVDVLLNLTAGMGGDFIPDIQDPSKLQKGSDLIGVDERIEHIRRIRPDICSFDCGSMNYAASAYIATPEMLRDQARKVGELGVKLEIECFELGQIALAKQLAKEGLIDDTPFFQLCMGVPWGAEANPESLFHMKSMLPANAVFSCFSISRHQMSFAALGVLAGGHVRVGLEDNLFLEKGVYATNAGLVERASELIGMLGSKVASPDEARLILGLKK